MQEDYAEKSGDYFPEAEGEAEFEGLKELQEHHWEVFEDSHEHQLLGLSLVPLWRLLFESDVEHFDHNSPPLNCEERFFIFLASKSLQGMLAVGLGESVLVHYQYPQYAEQNGCHGKQPHKVGQHLVFMLDVGTVKDVLENVYKQEGDQTIISEAVGASTCDAAKLLGLV